MKSGTVIDNQSAALHCSSEWLLEEEHVTTASIKERTTTCNHLRISLSFLHNFPCVCCWSVHPIAFFGGSIYFPFIIYLCIIRDGEVLQSGRSCWTSLGVRTLKFCLAVGSSDRQMRWFISFFVPSFLRLFCWPVQLNST